MSKTSTIFGTVVCTYPLKHTIELLCDDGTIRYYKLSSFERMDSYVAGTEVCIDAVRNVSTFVGFGPKALVSKIEGDTEAGLVDALEYLLSVALAVPDAVWAEAYTQANIRRDVGACDLARTALNNAKRGSNE